jgi:thioredoxin-like negative regulator of GroEL
MNFQNIFKIEEFEKVISDNLGVLVYFSTLKCSVGEALEPKVLGLIKKDFPKIVTYFVDMNEAPTLAAQYSVFVEPTILVFFDGKETLRKSRHISIHDLSNSISRIYKIAF